MIGLVSLKSLENFTVCVYSRHRGEVLDMGAHQEGAGAAPPQPQEEENHLQLYYWYFLPLFLHLTLKHTHTQSSWQSSFNLLVVDPDQLCHESYFF